MAQGQLKKKLTVRDIMGAKVDTLPEVRDMLAAGLAGKKPKPIALCRILGRTDKAKPGLAEKTGTEYVRFLGEFVAINLLTGERLSSGSVILPGAAETGLYGALGQLNDKGQAENTVEFGLEVSIRYDETAVTKYVYDVHSLIEQRVSSPMQALLEKAGVGADKQLEGPKAPKK